MADLDLGVPRAALEHFCRDWSITELAIFEAEPALGDRQDLAFLVTFASSAQWTLLDHLLMEQELEEILGRPLAVTSRQALEQSANRTRRRLVFSSARSVCTVKMHTHDEAALLDMKRAAWLVLQFTQDLASVRAFRADMQAHAAVCYQFLLLGEAAHALSEAFQAHHRALPWAVFARMRDLLLRPGYDVDLEQVWRLAQRDVPELFAQLETLVPGTAAQSRHVS